MEIYHRTDFDDEFVIYATADEVRFLASAVDGAHSEWCLSCDGCECVATTNLLLTGLEE